MVSLKLPETYEEDDMVKILSDNAVDIVIDVLENSNTFEKKHSTVYFGEDCWLSYTSNNSFIIRVEKGDVGLTIHASYTKTDKQITVIANKPSTSDFWDRIDDCDHYMSTFYDTEEEHFMDSTVKELAIPFKLMKAARDFILKYKKTGVYDAI